MGYRVLVVEDEMTIALLIEDMLEDMGHEVVGVPMRLNPALEAARTLDFDLAILDINLDGVKSFPVAEVLSDRGIPFAFASGYGASGLEVPFCDRPIIAKPFLASDLAAAVDAAAGRVRH